MIFILLKASIYIRMFALSFLIEHFVVLIPKLPVIKMDLMTVFKISVCHNRITVLPYEKHMEHEGKKRVSRTWSKLE